MSDDHGFLASRRLGATCQHGETRGNEETDDDRTSAYYPAGAYTTLRYPTDSLAAALALSALQPQQVLPPPVQAPPLFCWNTTSSSSTSSIAQSPSSQSSPILCPYTLAPRAASCHDQGQFRPARVGMVQIGAILDEAIALFDEADFFSGSSPLSPTPTTTAELQ